MTRLPDNAEIVFSSGRTVRFSPGVIAMAGTQGGTGPAGDFEESFRGAWDSGTSYLTGDIVTHGGSSWLAIDPSTNVTPVEGADWTAVALAGTNGTNGQGVPTGGSTNQVLAKTSGTDYATAWVSPSVGGLLASLSYSAADKSTTSTTIADVDSSNLAITFTAPPSGNVIVRLSGYCGHFGTAGTVRWGLRESTTTKGEVAMIHTTATLSYYASAAFRITGLTPGNSYTYKWAWRTSAGTTDMQISTFGTPSTMEVLAA